MFKTEKKNLYLQVFSRVKISAIHQSSKAKRIKYVVCVICTYKYLKRSINVTETKHNKSTTKKSKNAAEVESK